MSDESALAVNFAIRFQRETVEDISCRDNGVIRAPVVARLIFLRDDQLYYVL